eukprot:5986_1
MQMFNEMNALQEDEHLVFGFIRESESSLPSTTYYHIVKPIIMLTVKYFHDDPKMEVEKMNELKDKIHGLWDILDMDANGDVDREEFDVGLQTANIQLGHSQIHQLFDFIDSDRQTGYIDRQQFTLFLMTTWQNNNLQKLQNVFFHKIQCNSTEQKKISLIWNPTDTEILLRNIQIKLNESANPQKWEQEIMTSLNELHANLKCELWELDHPRLLRELGCDYDWITIIKTPMDVLQEELLNEKQKNPNFGKIYNCANWNKYEVASFLEQINAYDLMIPFVNKIIDGDILLNDLNEVILFNEFKMSKIQSMELLIEIEKLKNQVDDIKYESIDEIKSIDNDNDINMMQMMDSMRIAMESLVNEEIAKAQRLDELYEELEEKRKDSDFGRIDNCAQWNKYEVVSFLEE